MGQPLVLDLESYIGVYQVKQTCDPFEGRTLGAWQLV